MQVGEVLLWNGEASADTSVTMVRMAGALELSTVDVDITFTSITMCCYRGPAVTPATSMWLVQYRTADLTSAGRGDPSGGRGDTWEAVQERGLRRTGTSGRHPAHLSVLGGHIRVGRPRLDGGVAAGRLGRDRSGAFCVTSLIERLGPPPEPGGHLVVLPPSRPRVRHHLGQPSSTDRRPRAAEPGTRRLTRLAPSTTGHVTVTASSLSFPWRAVPHASMSFCGA